MIRVGDTAPVFTAEGVDGRTGEPVTVRLEDGFGRNQVLAFYPADGSPVCTEQLRAYTAGLGGLERLNARVLALSPQSVESHAAFVRSEGGFGFPLLADTDRSIAAVYGTLGLLDLYRRCVVIVDAAGVVRFVHRALGPGLGYLTVDRLAAHLESIVSTDRLSESPGLVDPDGVSE